MKRNSVFSARYLKWAKEQEKRDAPKLTNSQHRFAEWMLNIPESDLKMLLQIGNFDEVFKSISRFLKQEARIDARMVKLKP